MVVRSWTGMGGRGRGGAVWTRISEIVGIAEEMEIHLPPGLLDAEAQKDALIAIVVINVHAFGVHAGKVV